MPIVGGGKGGAPFNGGTITGPLAVSPSTASFSTVDLLVTGNPDATPDNDTEIFGVQDANNALRFDVESNGSVNVTLDTTQSGVFSVNDGINPLLSVRGAGTTVGTGSTPGVLIIQDIPTTDPGVAGQLYSVAGIVHISP